MTPQKVISVAKCFIVDGPCYLQIYKEIIKEQTNMIVFKRCLAKGPHHLTRSWSAAEPNISSDGTSFNQVYKGSAKEIYDKT